MRRCLLAPALIALAVGAGGCGGGEDPAPSSEEVGEVRPGAGTEVRERNARVREEHRQRQRAEAPTPEERRAERVAIAFYATLDETTIDSASFCALMSAAAKAETVRYAKVSSGAAQRWDCESAVELLATRSKRAGGLEGARRAEVIGVNAEGGRASATVRFGGGPATSVPLVREDGEWKLAASPAP